MSRSEGPSGFEAIEASYRALPRRHLIGTIIGLQLTLLLAALDQTIVSTAMPKIIESLNGFDRYAWVTTAYMLTSTTAVPIFGKLSDLYGRKWMLVSASLFFVAASALCGLSGEIPWLPHAGLFSGMNQLIFFRALQGIAGGTIMALCFTVIGDIFPPADRGRYQGLFSAVFALASVIGPSIGGWLTDTFSWRWVFYVNLPVGAVAVATLWIAFPDIKRAKSKAPIDYAGALSLIGFIVPLLVALTWVVDAGWAARPILILLSTSLLFLASFIFIESRASEPILPLSLFADKTTVLSCISLMLVGMGMFGAILFIPLFMQAVTGVSASQSGSLLTPMMLMMTAGSITSGQLSSRTGRYKFLSLIGLGLVLAGMLSLATASIKTGEMETLAHMMIIGLGLGLLMPVYTLAVQNAAPANMIGAATAATQFFRSVGGTLGTALFGSLMIARYLTILHRQLPANAPQAVLQALRNPLKLAGNASPLARLMHQGAIQASIPLNGAAVMTAAKQALVSGIDLIFMIGTLLIASALLLNLFLPELELRKSHKSMPSTDQTENEIALVPILID